MITEPENGSTGQGRLMRNLHIFLAEELLHEGSIYFQRWMEAWDLG